MGRRSAQAKAVLRPTELVLYYFLDSFPDHDHVNFVKGAEQRNWSLVGTLVGFPLFVDGDYSSEEEFTGCIFCSPPLVEDL